MTIFVIGHGVYDSFLLQKLVNYRKYRNVCNKFDIYVQMAANADQGKGVTLILGCALCILTKFAVKEREKLRWNVTKHKNTLHFYDEIQ